MEKGDFRRDRLAELGIDRLQRPPEHAWSARSRRFQDRWHRFTAGGWERTFFVGAAVVAIIVAAIGVVALASGGGGGENSGSASAQARSTEAKPLTGKATPTAITIGVPDIPTNLPTQTPLPEPTEEDAGDRTACDQIRGTPYRSNEERAWFEKNCGASVTNPPSRPPGTGNTPVPPPPTAPPPTSPPQGLTTSEVISLGVAWMTTSAPKAYTVDSSTCSAVHIGDHWIVSCTGRLAGCQSAACERDLQVCVYADRRVVGASSC